LNCILKIQWFLLCRFDGMVVVFPVKFEKVGRHGQQQQAREEQMNSSLVAWRAIHKWLARAAT
jgi:hypothetical protein